MKIALVSPYDFYWPGGVTAHISHLASSFRLLGHDVKIFDLPGQVGRANIPNNVEVFTGSILDTESIQNAFNRLFRDDFQKILTTVENPYGKGDATEKIMDVLKNKTIPIRLKKKFYDL
mgnify:CR=1 FL=1